MGQNDLKSKSNSNKLILSYVEKKTQIKSHSTVETAETPSNRYSENV